ncbi:GNAT family N-acetyltransferase [Salinarimonas sp.]|uniref:GNAT family N-acetyltransferase n=1 Tax=Salinarimonas sp. TaxID=2766526 RepID=UPI0032D9A5BC
MNAPAAPPLRIRPATPADADAVSAVLAASYGTLFQGWYAPAVLEAALPLMIRANPALLACGTYRVAQDETGRIVACGGWTAEAPGGAESPPDTGHIRHVATHPDLLRRGAARLIVETALAEARARGKSRMECLSTLQAEAFYARMGFAAVERVVAPIGPGGFPSVRMVRSF